MLAWSACGLFWACRSQQRVSFAIMRAMHYQLIQQMKKTLGQIDKWLETAATHAQAKSFDPKVYLELRLAPDQRPFSFQIQTACDTAKLAAARLSGKQAPSHPDNEQSLDDLRARVKSVIEHLGTHSEKDFEAAATRVISQPRWEGKVMNGTDYLLEHALPNFYFHASHTYAILRHNGVSLGKRDFLGTLTMSAQ
jgi:hypothetical protein